MILVNGDNQAEGLGDVVSIFYEFNRTMSEAEMLQHSTKVPAVEDLRLRLLDLKKADLVFDAAQGQWNLTKKGRAMVKQSVSPGH